MPRARQPRPTELGETLTQLRETLGLTTTQLGARTGLTQSAVSQAEHGRTRPDRKRLDTLLAALQPDPATRARLSAIVDGAEHRRTVLHRPDAPRYQQEYRDLETAAARIRSFTATIAPGLAQTPDYARAVIGHELTGAARDRWLRTREQRRTLLEEPARDIELVIHTSALTVNRGGPHVMTAQLDRLTDISRINHVRVGIITADTDVGSAGILNNIDYYERADGQRRVIVGTSEGTAIVTDDASTDHHAALLDRLAELAVWGEQAREELREVRRWYEA